MSTKKTKPAKDAKPAATVAPEAPAAFVAPVAPSLQPAGGTIPDPETAAERKARLAKDPLVTLVRPKKYPEGHIKEGEDVPGPHSADVPRSEVANWVQTDQLWEEE